MVTVRALRQVFVTAGWHDDRICGRGPLPPFLGLCPEIHYMRVVRAGQKLETSSRNAQR